MADAGDAEALGSSNAYRDALELVHQAEDLEEELGRSHARAARVQARSEQGEDHEAVAGQSEIRPWQRRGFQEGRTMRALQTLNTVGATTIALGDVEFIKKGQRVIIGAKDSVATATLSVKFAGVEVFSGPLAIESGTDVFRYPEDIVTQFIAMQDGQMQATLGGTVAGARVNFLVLMPGEPTPW